MTRDDREAFDLQRAEIERTTPPGSTRDYQVRQLEAWLAGRAIPALAERPSINGGFAAIAWAGYLDIESDRPVHEGGYVGGIPYMTRSQWLRDHDLAGTVEEFERYLNVWRVLDSDYVTHQNAQAKERVQA